MARKIVREADRMTLPGRSPEPRTPSTSRPAGPALVRGRGLGRRRPRRSLGSLLGALLGIAVLLLALLLFLG